MSGGHFNYTQYSVKEVSEEIELLLDRQGKVSDDKWQEVYETYPKEVQDIFKEAIIQINKASEYIHRIDWYLCGDDGEETFLEKINKL
jgi:hypothetical protein